MTCVINDSDPEAVENKHLTAKEQEQKKKKKKREMWKGEEVKDIGL